MNGVLVCLEEIALEGLDGITVSTLWRRIKSAPMWSNFDESYKEFLWRCVASCQDILAYLLEKPRNEVLDFADDSEIYPYCCINESGIRGSCSTFKTRKPVNVSNLSLQNVVETYGNQLVLVASQLLRNKVLFGPEFDVSVKIPDSFYCLLEIIGRSRRLGCLQSQLGIKTFVDSRTLFNQVKTLLKLQLITKQSVYSKIKMAPTSVIYLSRYHIEHGNESIQYKISEALFEASEAHMPLDVLCLQLDEKFEIVEKAVEDLSKSGHVCYVEEVNTVSGSCSTRLTDTQKLPVGRENKVVQFVHHFHNLWPEVDMEFEDEEWMQPDYQELSVSLPAEVPIMHAIYNFVKSKGEDGASLSQCCQELSMPFFKMRRVLKDLENLQVLFCKFEDIANTRKNQYFARSPVTQAQGNPCVPLHQNSQLQATQITHLAAIQTTQPSNVQPTHPLTIQSTQPPDVVLSQSPCIQTTQPLAVQITHLPAIQTPQPSTVHPTHPLTIQSCQPLDVPLTQPTAIETTQSHAVQNTNPQAVPAANQPDNQAIQSPTCQTSQCRSTQVIQSPAVQIGHATSITHFTATSATQMSELNATPITKHKVSGISLSLDSQVPIPPVAANTQASATCNTQSPSIHTTQLSATKITNPQMSQVTHTSTSQSVKRHASQKLLMPTTQAEFVVLNNPETTVKESAIMDDTPQLSTKPCSIDNTTEQTQTSVSSRSQKLINTERFLRRKETILNLLKNLKVVEGENLFTRIIRMEENKMGLNINIDKRSVLCLLDKLTGEGLLNRVEMNVKVEAEEHKVKLFCDKSIQQDGEEIVSCIQRFKDRIIYEKAKRNGFFDNKTNPNSTFLPKMPRCELLHIFLFYIIYELNNPNADLEAWRRKYDWAEYLKPEHAPRRFGKGWFTPYSILMLLPVSLYCKLVGNAYQNNTVKKYFDNPATEHMLLKDLPPLARQGLVARRKNYFLFGNFEFLACFGLITPTNKQVFFHERDIVCYLHTSTVLKDTCDSEPAYDNAQHPEGGDFPERAFTFSGLADVEQYWSTVRRVCMSTPLNRRKFHSSQKKPRFKIDLQSLIVDEKQIPSCSKPWGDGLGAAGFDSRMYCHLSQKWNWSLKEKLELGSDVEDSLDWNLCFASDDLLSQSIAVASGMKKTRRKRKKRAEDKTTNKKRKVEDCNKKKAEASQNVAQRSSQSDAASSAQPNSSSNPSKNVGKVKKRRKKRKRKKKEVEQESNTKPGKPKEHGHWSKVVHDKRDEDALKQLQAKRNTFTPQQQKLLFISSVALRILGKKSTDTGYSDWLWTRDILYKDNYESAKTKTALSISRKYRSMMGNAQTRTNLNICVADCMQEKEFQPYCNLRKSCTEVMFNELVELLKKKYSMESMVSKPLILPSTMQEFQQQKNLYNSLEIQNLDRSDEEILPLEPREASVADIRQRIIRDSIVSALLLANEEYQSHVAFKFLSQFTEEELIIAISVLKNRRLVVRKKLRYAKGFDLASCAFSQMLSSVGHHTIDNHFPGSLVDDAKSFYDEIKCSTNFVSLEDDQNSEKSLTLNFSKNSLVGGQVYCLFSLLTCQRLAVNMEVPVNILAMEKNQKPKISKLVPENLIEKRSPDVNNETSEREELSSPSTASTPINTNPPETARQTRESEVGRNTETTYNVSQTSLISVRSVKTRENPIVTRASDHEEINDVDQVTAQTTMVQNKNVGDTCKEESRLALSGNVNRKQSRDMVFDVLCGIEDHLFGSQGLESNMSLYKVNLKPTSTFTCTMTTSDINSVRTSCKSDVIGNVEKSSLQNNNNAYESYLEKIATYRCTGDVNRIQFSINPCVVQIRFLSVTNQIPTPKVESLAQNVAHYFKSSGLRMPSTIDECIGVCSKTFGYASEDCEALRTVYETINSSKELGLSSVHVNKLVRRRHFIINFSTDGLIKVLEAFNLVYQVGFVEVCYVTKAFKEHWFLTYHESDVRSSSEVMKLQEHQTNSVKRKRSNFHNERNEDSRTKPAVTEESERRENVGYTVLPTDNMASLTMQEQTLSARTRSKTAGEQISTETRTDTSIGPNDTCSSDDDNFGKQKHFQISTQTQTDSSSSKLSRPWITMAGEMNTNAYNTLHRTVLGYIIKYPGVQKHAITKHFLNLMFPVTTDEILRRLEECECIKQDVCYLKKMTLFSSRARRKASYYLPKADAMFKLMDRVFL